MRIYRLGIGNSRPLETFAWEAAVLAQSGWRVAHQTQSGQRYIGLVGWQPTTVTVTYERPAAPALTDPASSESSGTFVPPSPFSGPTSSTP